MSPLVGVLLLASASKNQQSCSLILSARVSKCLLVVTVSKEIKINLKKIPQHINLVITLKIYVR